MEIRRYGKTTGMALEAIGKALQNPGTKFNVGDDKHQNPASMAILDNCISSVIKHMGLRDIDVDSSGVGLTIRSNYFGNLITASGTSYRVQVEEI